MIYLLTDKRIIKLYDGTDAVYKKMNFFQKWRFNRLMKKVVSLIEPSRSLKLVCEEDTISYTLKIAKMFNKPVIIAMDKDQYLSTSEYWSDYVCFK